MPRVKFGNILGGVNYAIPANELPKHFLAHSSNLLPDNNGYAKQRGGSSIMNATPYGSIINSFHEVKSGGNSYLMAGQASKIGKYNSVTGAFDDHITGLTSGYYGQWIDYGDYAIFANGANKPQKTDGTTGSDLTTDLAGIAGGQCLAEWGERVWVGGYSSEIARLVGSALRAPTDFSTTTTDIGWWDGYVGNKADAITGLCPYFDMLLIGKLNRLYMLTGAPETATSTFRLQPVYTKDRDSVGFTSKTAIAQVGNDILFLDGFLIKAFSGVTQYGDIESINIVGNIRDFLLDSSGAGLDKDYLKFANFFHYKAKEQIYCTIPTGATTRYWFVIDYGNQNMRSALGLPKYSFYPMAGLTPLCFGGVENGSNLDVYMGGPDGYVRKLDTGTNDGASAVSSFGVWAVGDPEINITCTYATLAVKYTTACTITAAYAYGLQDWKDVTNASNFSAPVSHDVTSGGWITRGSVAQKTISPAMLDGGNGFALKIAHNQAGEEFELRGCSMNIVQQHGYV